MSFRLYPVGGSTTLTIREVWAPPSLGSWVWGLLRARRSPQRDVTRILEQLRRIVSPP